MILDVRHGPFRLLVSCTGDENVGDTATLVWSLCSAAIRNNAIAEEKANLFRGERTLNLSEVETILKSLQEAMPNQSSEDNNSGDITLWWIRKPVPRSAKLMDKFGTSNRTKCVVVLGSASFTSPPNVPEWPEQKNRPRAIPESTMISLNRQQEAVKRAKEIQVSHGLLSETDLARIQTNVDLRFDRRLKQMLADICLADDPQEALRNLLHTDEEMRRLCDQFLLAIGRAVVGSDGQLQLV